MTPFPLNTNAQTMRFTTLFFIIFFITACHIMADPASPEIALANEIRQAEGIFQARLGEPDTRANIEKVLIGKSTEPMSAGALMSAIDLWHLKYQQDPSYVEILKQSAKIYSENRLALLQIAKVLPVSEKTTSTELLRDVADHSSDLTIKLTALLYLSGSENLEEYEPVLLQGLEAANAVNRNLALKIIAKLPPEKRLKFKNNLPTQP